MDKNNKNRTDLLAAGRKKLQQFRQKKDGKGAKPSGKSSKPERIAMKVATTSQHTMDGEVPPRDDDDTVASSELDSMKDRVDVDSNVGTVDLSTKDSVVESTSMITGEDIGVSEPEVNQDAGSKHGDIIIVHEGGGSCEVHDDVELVHSETSETILPERESWYSDMPLPAATSSQVERENGEEQVPDVGVMQETASSGSLHADSISDIGIERVAVDDRNMEVKEATTGIAKITEPGDICLTVAGTSDAEGAQDIHVHSVNGQPSPQSEGFVAEPAHVPGEQTNDAPCSAKSAGKVDLGGEKADGRGSSKYKVDDFPRSLGTSMLTLSSGSDVYSISMSQLAEVIQRLDEDEFRLVLKSRESPVEKLTNTPNLNAPESAICDVFERLKDQLYLLSFAKDTTQLQLTEQSEHEMLLHQQFQKLVDEISVAGASLNEVQGKNEMLSEELAQCRSQLQEVVQKQLHESKVEADQFSARVSDLQNKLEMSEADLASLASELTDCKNSVAALHTENEDLNGRLSLVKEEKLILVQEKDKMTAELLQYKASLTHLQLENMNLTESLTLLREEKRQLDEDKERLVHENDKLHSDLVDYKGMVDTLQAENTNLNAVLAAVEEEKKKLEEGKECFLHENAQLLAELVNSRGSMEALQTEMSNLNETLASLTDERKKLEEEKQYHFSNSESQLHELADGKVVIAGLQGELSKVIGDLKEASLRIEQLTEENVILRTKLDMHMAEIPISKDTSLQAEDPGERNLLKDTVSYHIARSGGSEIAVSVLEKNSSESHAIRSLFGQLEPGDSNDLSDFAFWRRHLEEANKVLQTLENTVEELHSYSTLSRSTAKSVAPAVSRLIQAFESKKHTDDQEIAEPPSSESLTVADPYTQTKEQTEYLKVVFKQLFLHAENASKFLEGERKSRISAEVSGAELRASYDSLKSSVNHLEEENIELMVLCEALRQHIHNTATRFGELELLYEASQKQEYALQAENGHLREDLRCFHAKISEFLSQLDEICRNSDEMVASISSRVGTLQKEVGDRGSMLEEDWRSFVSQIVQEVRKLDVSIETIGSFISSTGLHNRLDVGLCIMASIDAATRVIETLQGQLMVTQSDHEVVLGNYTELNKEFKNLQEKNEKAVAVLEKIYGNLRNVVNGSCGHADGTETGLENQKLLDPLDYGVFDIMMQQLGSLLDEKMQQLRSLLDEKMQLESVNNELNSDMMGQVREIDELKRRSLDSDTIMKLFKNAERAFKLDSFDVRGVEPLSCIKSLISILTVKYEEAEQKISLSNEKSAYDEMHVSNLHEEMNHLSSLLVKFDIENIVLKESWKMVSEDILVLRSELLEKVAELEQSEQRVSSLRDKLGIAVTKGKGLVMQRDSLKQSLAETSIQLEKCSQELQSKDVRIHELETKLKNYSEAGERMEALESELSYIRNSATALRESFLLKDSVLQRIEEILEDLELPEHFHSGGIIEKVDWLAKSVTGNTLPLTDWDQKSSVGGGSYSDSGFVIMDGWKQDTQSNQNSIDEFRRRYEELQTKFYGLAEQNEMLEQSLMERNNLVQRWEDVLGNINVPLPFRSLEPEDRIQWLGSALSEAQDCCNSLQQRIDDLDTLCGSLNVDLGVSQCKISELESGYQSVTMEREFLLKNLETLNQHYDEISKKASQLKSENENLLKEVSALQRIHHIEAEVVRLQDLIRDALQGSGIDDPEFGSDGTECLERMLRKLIEKYTMGKPVNLDVTDVRVNEEDRRMYHEESIRECKDAEKNDVTASSKKLEDSLVELMYLKEERDRYKESNQSLVFEVEEFDLKNKELQELLNQEEQKSASLREKLTVAVKKGKSLVQQRDSMKQVIEEVNAEVAQLKSEISLRENAVIEYEQRIRSLSINQERTEAIESECVSLRDRLAETEHHLQGKEHILSMILNSLKDVDDHVGLDFENPVEKMKAVGKRYRDLSAALVSSEQESKKSKRAAELLLAELNEVQERNDGLQEELAKVASELSEISRQKMLSEAAKSEALAELESLSAVQSEERDHLFNEVTILRSNVDQLREDLSLIDNLVADVLSNDLEILQNLETSIKSCLEPTTAPRMAAMHTVTAASGDIILNKLKNKIFMTEMSSLIGKLCRHDNLLQEEVSHISGVLQTIHIDVASLKHSTEARESHLMLLESIVKEKDSELFATARNISLLYEACTISITEIENWKAQQFGNGLATKTEGINLISETSVHGENSFPGGSHLFPDESIIAVREKLLSIVKDLLNMQNEILEGSQNEMKTVVMNLQKELHEKDIQRDRISMEFVSQIKEAEAVAKNLLQDLQSAKTQADDLRSQVIVMEEERQALENGVKELENQKTTLLDLQQRVTSLTDALAAKEQETEALMQALDEEESQMEDMSNKIKELEKSLRLKNEDLENLEASRGKALKKLSITLSKFDELHHLSESLLSEVEKLQSQLHERDGEISFLRQEVTRCTNEALTASQISRQTNSDEIQELLTWLETIISQVQVHDVQVDDAEVNLVHRHKQLLQKQITSIITELEELRVLTQNKDVLLQVERGRVEELIQKEEFLENSLREKESQLTMLKRVGDSGQATSTGSEIVEVEPMINKRAASGIIASQVRSGRKTNSDQVAIAIDMDPSSGIQDEDDDKAHGFKSLTTSRIVPRFTRPVSNMIDGLWVSCDRALMRQPALRLGVIIYWAILHALLAAFVV